MISIVFSDGKPELKYVWVQSRTHFFFLNLCEFSIDDSSFSVTLKHKLTSHFSTEIYRKRWCKLHRSNQKPIKYKILSSENFGFEFFPPFLFLFLYGKSKISKIDSSISTYLWNVLMQSWAFCTYKAMCKIWNLLNIKKFT